MNNVIQLEERMKCCVCGSASNTGKTMSINLEGLISENPVRNLLICNNCIVKEVADRFSFFDQYLQHLASVKDEKNDS